MNAARIASSALAAVGLVILALGFFLLQRRQAQIRRWKPVDAQVIRAWMEEQSGDESTTYSANYELTYTVDGKPMRSAARSEDIFLVSADRVQARLARHAPGTHGVVFVNPDNPSQVRLNFQSNAQTLALPLWVMLPGFSLLLFAFSIWLIGTPGIDW
jgi:hypothetical protein